MPTPPPLSGWETLTATCNTVYGSTTALYDFSWNPRYIHIDRCS